MGLASRTTPASVVRWGWNGDYTWMGLVNDATVHSVGGWGGNGGFTWMGLASLTIVASVGGGLEWVLYLDGACQRYTAPPGQHVLT